MLHKFTNNPDGEEPESLLIEDSIGNLYGTTFYSRADVGTVFKVSREGKEKVLYTFPRSNYTYGAYPDAGVVSDSKGNLYGTTASGRGVQLRNRVQTGFDWYGNRALQLHR